MVRGLDAQVRRMLSEPVSGLTGNYTTLASLGIRTTITGTLQLDATAFQKALAADAGAVGKVFSSTSGVAVKLASVMDSKLSSGGELTARDTRIANRRRDLTQQKDALDARMQVIQQRYLKQFTALDTMLSQMQSTSSYLTQQLSSLNKSG
jgi:flagellar hook-associated protein 2